MLCSRRGREDMLGFINPEDPPWKTVRSPRSRLWRWTWSTNPARLSGRRSRRIVRNRPLHQLHRPDGRVSDEGPCADAGQVWREALVTRKHGFVPVLRVKVLHQRRDDPHEVSQQQQRPRGLVGEEPVQGGEAGSVGRCEDPYHASPQLPEPDRELPDTLSRLLFLAKCVVVESVGGETPLYPIQTERPAVRQLCPE
jgi:hypothetical protein